MNITSESPNDQDPDDLSSDVGDSADDGDGTDAESTQAAPAGGPVRSATMGHDGVGGTTRKR